MAGSVRRGPLSVPASSTFARLFPRAAVTLEGLAAAVKLAGWLARTVWAWRVELLTFGAAWWCWRGLSALAGGPVAGLFALVVPVVVVVVVLAVPPASPGVAGWLSRHRWVRWLRHGFGTRLRLAGVLGSTRWGRAVLWVLGALARARTRRRLRAGMRELRLANVSGKLPWVRRVCSTAVGERVVLHCRPGQSAELLDTRVEEFRAAVRARDVRITRDLNRSDRLYVDVIRRDPLAVTARVRWLGGDHERLSMWDPVHFGTDESGQAVHLSVIYRQVLMGGGQDSGKSTGGRVIIAHAAKSPDCHLLLIDPNKVQFSPWSDRALAFATNDPDDAIDVLQLARAEIDRRADLLDSLPGVEEKITREIAEAHGLPVWLIACDELAYFTSVVGTPAQQRAFGTLFRDVTARGRFVLMTPLVLTQRPTSDVVPTSLRDLFAIRVAYRCNTPTASDVILGDNWARQGYTASDIGLDSPGLAWLHSTGGTPRRVKTALIPPSTVAELRTSTIGNRPPAPGRPVTVLSDKRVVVGGDRPLVDVHDRRVAGGRVR